MKELYRLENISKIDGKNQRLRNLTMVLPENQIIIFMGPSGSGKTTLLNLLAGFEKPTSGNLFFQGHNITFLNDRKLTMYRRKYIGFMHQQYPLIPNITVKENIELGLRLASSHFSLKQLISLCQLQKHLWDYPYQLSGGKRQQVAFAQAISKNPKVLLCDEPTASLDPKSKKIMLDLLKKIHQRYHISMILVTHDEEVAQIGNQMIRLKNGKIDISSEGIE